MPSFHGGLQANLKECLGASQLGGYSCTFQEEGGAPLPEAKTEMDFELVLLNTQTKSGRSHMLCSCVLLRT